MMDITRSHLLLEILLLFGASSAIMHKEKAANHVINDFFFIAAFSFSLAPFE